MAHEVQAVKQQSQRIELFEDKQIRSAWNNEEQEWYFSIVDVVGVLTESANYQTAREYWNKLKERLRKEGSQLVTDCHQLKMTAADGKMRQTDVASTEQILRIIQSIPSKKAEPFKLWLAQVGAERIDETINPELAIDRALETYVKKGYSEGWIRQRLLAIDIRKELTQEWKNRGIKEGKEFALLTDDITHAWSGMSTRQYKDLKGLKKENLRDNMSNTELVLNMLAETTTTDISRAEHPEGINQNRDVARRGGTVAGNARKQIESETGKPVITSMNALDFAQVIVGVMRSVDGREDDVHE